MEKLTRFFLLTLVALFFSCQPPHVNVYQGPPRYGENDYNWVTSKSGKSGVPNNITETQIEEKINELGFKSVKLTYLNDSIHLIEKYADWKVLINSDSISQANYTFDKRFTKEEKSLIMTNTMLLSMGGLLNAYLMEEKSNSKYWKQPLLWGGLGLAFHVTITFDLEKLEVHHSFTLH